MADLTPPEVEALTHREAVLFDGETLADVAKRIADGPDAMVVAAILAATFGMTHPHFAKELCFELAKVFNERKLRIVK